MKKLLLKFISLALIIAMLMPTVIACTKEPPPSNDDDDNLNETEDKYIKSSLKEYKTLVLTDYESEDFKAVNSKLDTYLETVEGKVGYRYNTLLTPITFTLENSETDLIDYHYITFSIYNETPCDVELSIRMVGWRATPTFSLNFKGWRTFSIEIDTFTVVNPTPTVSSIYISKSSGTADTTVYVSEICATLPIYEAQPDDGIDLNDESIYKDITSSFKEYLMGASEGTSEEFTKKLASVNGNCASAWQSLKNTKSPSGKNEIHTLFGLSGKGIDASDGKEYEANGADVLRIYTEIQKLAYGYGLPGSTYYQNEELLADIIYALEYCYEYYYGKNIVETGATNGNWWEWDVGIPFALTEILCIIEDDVANTEIQKYLEPFDTITPLPVGTGANLIDIAQSVIISAAFDRDADRICAAKELLAPLFIYTDDTPENVNNDGFYHDGSFIQHNFIPYAGLYGYQLISHLAAVLYFTNDSYFEFVGEEYLSPYNWIFDSFRPFIYGESFMSAVRGRSISYYSELYAYQEVVTAFIKLAYCAPDSKKTEIETMIRALMLDGDTDFTQHVPIALIDYCVYIRNNENLTVGDPYVNMQVFGHMDRAVQHREDYSVALSLNSTRIARYESINTNNEAAWYHSDGMLYIYTEDYDFSFEFFSYANQYLMPGVTSNSAKRIQTCIHPMMFNAKPYAGGAQQGNYAAIGYMLDYNGTDLRETFVNSNDAKLSANKSYFFFDNEIICVGSDIDDSSGNDVFTTIENRIFNDGDEFYVLKDGSFEAVTPTASITETSTRAMWFTGMGGYVFLSTAEKDSKDGNYLYFRKVLGKTNDTIAPPTNRFDGNEPSFLEIIMEHRTGGATVSNGKYFYAYLPNATLQETSDYNANPDAVLLKYHETVHAVLEKNLGIVAVNFFDSDSTSQNVRISGGNTAYTDVTEIKAETPASVIVSKNENGEYQISLCDPTQTYTDIIVNVSITGITEVVNVDSGVRAEINGGILQIKATVRNLGGSTLNLTVK